MSDQEQADIIWELEPIGREAGVLNPDGTVNKRVTQDRLRRGIIPGWKRGRRWQSARSVIRKVLTSS
jgi:hypothetical protein